jgi:hypothetical protein
MIFWKILFTKYGTLIYLFLFLSGCVGISMYMFILKGKAIPVTGRGGP